MPSRLAVPKGIAPIRPGAAVTEPAPATAERPATAPATAFDKAFPVYLEGDRGTAGGIGRNITETGIFVETREPYSLGTRVRVTFPSQSGVELTLEGEVRYQCFINFSRKDQSRAGLRGIGIKFVPPGPALSVKRGGVH